MPVPLSKKLLEEKPLLEDKTTRKDVILCAVATFVACQLSFLTGVSQGYSAILLAQLKTPGSIFTINADQASWIASLGTICRPVGALVEGIVVDRYGRRTTMQIVAILISCSWLLTYFSQSVAMLYFSRILLSYALGMVICVGLYIAEISRPSDRGTLLSLITPSTMGGTLFVYVLGYLFTWETTALILCLYSLIIFAFMCLIPESHLWYMIKFKKPKAVQALLWLRNNKVTAVEVEIQEAEDRIKHLHQATNYLENFKDPAVWKPFLILVGFSLFQQQVGYNIITYYAVDFFSSFESEYDGNVLSIIFAALSTVGSFLLMTVIHKFNRKTLLCVSGLGMTISMAIGAIALSIDKSKSFSSIPVGCVFIYILFCMMGMIDIPWMMVGEMFPSRVRGTMSANVTVVIFIITFFNVKLYPFFNDAIGVVGLFWYFSIFSLLTVIFGQLLFPETRGKSLFQIEDEFRER